MDWDLEQITLECLISELVDLEDEYRNLANEHYEAYRKYEAKSDEVFERLTKICSKLEPFE